MKNIANIYHHRYALHPRTLTLSLTPNNVNAQLNKPLTPPSKLNALTSLSKNGGGVRGGRVGPLRHPASIGNDRLDLVISRVRMRVRIRVRIRVRG